MVAAVAFDFGFLPCFEVSLLLGAQSDVQPSPLGSWVAACSRHKLRGME